MASAANNEMNARLDRLEQAVGELARAFYGVSGPARVARRAPALAQLLARHEAVSQRPEYMVADPLEAA